MKLLQELQEAHLKQVTRRHFLRDCTTGMGAIALGSLIGCNSFTHKEAAAAKLPGLIDPMAQKSSHFAARAKRIIYLHMAGAPSQLELFDYKPELMKLDGKDCPESFLKGKRFAFIQGVPQMLGPQASFKQYGQSGTWLSEHLPHFSTMADEVALLKAMHTDEFNHAPAQLLLHTGSPRLGRPSMGAWVTYGLGTENDNLPGYIVLVSGGKTPSAGKSVWGSGFLPTVYQGVQCRSKGDPVLYVSNPEGMNRDIRKRTIETINQINQEQFNAVKDPEILSRISQYEMAFRMQVSVPEVMDISQEPEYIHQDVRHRAGQVFLCQQLPACPPPHRKRRALCTALRLGVGLARHQRIQLPGCRVWQLCSQGRQTDDCLAERFEAKGPAGRKPWWCGAGNLAAHPCRKTGGA